MTAKVIGAEDVLDVNPKKSLTAGAGFQPLLRAYTWLSTPVSEEDAAAAVLF